MLIFSELSSLGFGGVVIGFQPLLLEAPSVALLHALFLLLAEEEWLQDPEVILHHLQRRGDKFFKRAGWQCFIEFVNPVLKADVEDYVLESGGRFKEDPSFLLH